MAAKPRLFLHNRPSCSTKEYSHSHYCLVMKHSHPWNLNAEDTEASQRTRNVRAILRIPRFLRVSCVQMEDTATLPMDDVINEQGNTMLTFTQTVVFRFEIESVLRMRIERKLNKWKWSDIVLHSSGCHRLVVKR